MAFLTKMHEPSKHQFSVYLLSNICWKHFGWGKKKKKKLISSHQSVNNNNNVTRKRIISYWGELHPTPPFPTIHQTAVSKAAKDKWQKS
jgi:hypothetical protein